MEQAEITKLIGPHNYYRVSVHDAVDLVQESIDAAGLPLIADVAIFNTIIPPGSVAVGKVKVHPGDVSYWLYVLPKKKELP